MSEQPNKSTPPMRKRRPGQKPTKEERATIQDVFLQSFSLTANIRAACLKAGIDRRTLYEWAEHDQEFSMRYEIAKKDADDMIRAELFRRGVQGYEKPLVSLGRAVYDQDGKMLTERVYSDNLLSLLAKARMPEFREKQQVELTGKDGGPIRVDYARFSDEELAMLETLAQKAINGKQG